MHSFEGRLYHDDRLFILDLSWARKGTTQVWAVIMRRNCEGFPAFRVDDFTMEEEAIIFIKKIEPETPRISLGGRSPDPTPTYEEHCDRLSREGVPSALEFRQLNRNIQREIIITDVLPGELEE